MSISRESIKDTVDNGLLGDIFRFEHKSIEAGMNLLRMGLRTTSIKMF